MLHVVSGIVTFGLVAAGDTDMTAISAAIIYKLLLQWYLDAGAFVKTLTGTDWTRLKLILHAHQCTYVYSLH